MTERHEKWVRVETGKHVPAGTPFRVEFAHPNYRSDDIVAEERGGAGTDWIVPETKDAIFIDGHWVGLPVKASFIGGKLDGVKTELLHAPAYVEVLGERYDRIDDPDTGKYLGGYAIHYEGKFETQQRRFWK